MFWSNNQREAGREKTKWWRSFSELVDTMEWALTSSARKTKCVWRCFRLEFAVSNIGCLTRKNQVALQRFLTVLRTFLFFFFKALQGELSVGDLQESYDRQRCSVLNRYILYICCYSLRPCLPLYRYSPPPFKMKNSVHSSFVWQNISTKTIINTQIGICHCCCCFSCMLITQSNNTEVLTSLLSKGSVSACPHRNHFLKQ